MAVYSRLMPILFQEKVKASFLFLPDFSSLLHLSTRVARHVAQNSSLSPDQATVYRRLDIGGSLFIISEGIVSLTAVDRKVRDCGNHDLKMIFGQELLIVGEMYGVHLAELRLSYALACTCRHAGKQEE